MLYTCKISLSIYTYILLIYAMIIIRLALMNTVLCLKKMGKLGTARWFATAEVGR